ncbi:MAG: glycine/betaine ABC transporter substrate-binding protein [Pseudonocardiaceae bacterium]|nr:glycine/betaine ABC transporter substrate-binding protein [Pseudonocardiaceae bacterium]
MRARRLVAVALAAAAFGTSACGLETTAALPFNAEPASIKPEPSLQGVAVTVGSKDFTENILLGYITEIALQAAGADVVDMTNIQGSASARQALEKGEIDLSWEYTGTGWINYLGNDKPIPNEERQFQAVKKADLQENGIAWLKYSPVNNTYAFALNKKSAQQLNVDTVSELATELKKQPRQAVYCVETEFASRPDGFPGVAKTYGLPVTDTKSFGTGAVYAALNENSCPIGEVFTTDGRILAFGLKVLKDDKQFFPQYNAAITMKQEFLEQHPAIRKVMAPIAAKLNNEEMIKMGAKVDVEGQNHAEVARDWLADNGFIKRG